MSDINVTVGSHVQTTVNIPKTVSQVMVSTKTPDLSNYVTRSETGNLVSAGGGISQSQLDNTTGILVSQFLSLITNSTVGVSTLNGISGVINLTGSGNVIISKNGQTLIVSGDTGVYVNFYQNSNPQSFSNSGNLSLSGSNLQSQISLLNAWSGQVTGYILGSQTGQFYPKSNPFSFSTTGDLQASGANLQSQIANLNIWSGQLTGSYYPLRSNPSGYITSSQTGQFYPLSNPYNFANSGDLSTSGSSFQSQLSKINTWTGAATGDYYPRFANPSGYSTLTALNAGSGVLDSRLSSTGAAIIALITSSSAGVASLNGTSGVVNLAGQGNVSVAVNGQTINISGNTGAYSNFYNISNPFNFTNSGNLESTGIALQGQINTLNTWTGQSTGAYYPSKSNPSGYVTSLQTGQFYPNSNPQAFVNTGNLAAYYLITNPSNFANSGNLSISGSNFQSQLSTLSVWTGQSTGSYYPLGTNPSGFTTQTALNNSSGVIDSRLFNTGINLVNLINNLGIGVVSLNTISGSISLTGSGNIIISRNGQVIIVSGDTGTYINFYQNSNPQSFSNSGNLNSSGANLQGQISSLSVWSGQSTGAYYPLGSNPSGYIGSSQTGQFYPTSNPQSFANSGNLSISGSNLQSQLSLLNIWTGQATGYYLVSNPQSFVNSGNLISSGSNLQSQISNLNIWSGQSTGYYYPFSNPYSFATSGNLATSGANLQSQLSILSIWTGQSTGGYYPLGTNPSGYSTTTALNNASGVLNSKIGGSTAGVSNLNNLTGATLITGTGIISLTVVGQTIFISGDTGSYVNFYQNSNPQAFSTSGNLATSGSNLQSQISTLNIWTGQSTGAYYLSSNPAGYIGSSQTGQFYPVSNPQAFSTSGNLSSSGSNFQSQLSLLNLWSGQSTGAYYPYNFNPSGYSTVTALNNSSGVLDGRLSNTGANLITLINSVGIGVITVNAISGNILLTGTGNITIIKTGQTIFVSGDTGTYANFYQNSNPQGFSTSGNLATSGSNFQSQFSIHDSWTGQSTGTYYPYKTNPSGYITSSQTGQFYPASNLYNFANSGNLNLSGSTLDTKINSLSGYVTGIYVTGITNLGVGSGLSTAKVGPELRLKSISGYSGIILSTDANNIAFCSTSIINGSSGLQTTTTMTSANTYYDAASGQINGISGDQTPRLYLVYAQAIIASPINLAYTVTSKLWNPNAATVTVWGASENSVAAIAAGSGMCTVDITSLVTLTGTSMVTLSCASTITGCRIRHAPMNSNLQIPTGICTSISFVRLA